MKLLPRQGIHDTLYRALNQPLVLFFELSLELCKAIGSTATSSWRASSSSDPSGKLGLKIASLTKKTGDTATGAQVFGLSRVVLAWADGKRRLPLAFLPQFGKESKRDPALALLEWAEEAGFRPERVLFDAWCAALLAHGALGLVVYGRVIIDIPHPPYFRR